MPKPVKRPVRPGKSAPATQAKVTPAARLVSSRKPLPAKVSTPTDMTKVRAQTEWVDINDIIPYVYNARDNAKAIAAVAKSIETFGFVVPVVIDDEGNLAAGHTRVEAAKSLGMAEVLAVRASHMTTEQIDAFRLVDNKVAELADWDTDLLGPELARLSEFGFSFTDYGWTQEEIDCMSSVVAADCLAIGDLTPATSEEETEEDEQGNRVGIRRGPQTTRFVLGEFVLFVPTTAYKAWIDGMRRMTNYNEAELQAEIKNRLGILE